MKSLRRVVNYIIEQANTASDHLHMARAYRPVSNKMIPRWRNLGKSITPYHFMHPAVIPVQPKQGQKNKLY